LGDLPAEATSFIGRRRELAEIRKKLTEARLVSLVGPGGVGKTRLAIRASTDLARGFPGGACLVELAEVGNPALVGNAVMGALDLRDQAGTEPVAVLRSYLRDKQLLLVVDNCEHLLAAAAPLVAEILAAAPGVRVIATSREPLTVPGEHVVPVPPLELPSTQAGMSLGQVRQNEAVMLFAERAAAGSGRFELTADNQAAVVDLCRRLDGLPLAIELAAVRTRVLTVAQILDRLTDRFGLLTGGGRAALPRHQTLRTTIDWSHDLLTAGEQTLLRRLCIFTGRFTLDDVEVVCTCDQVPAARALEALSSLVDKSLVVKEDAKDVACYRLHETMREYAGLKLREAGETDTVELRCAEYYQSRCQRSAAEARFRLVEWLDWMDLEIDNIRAVLRRCLARRDSRRGLDLASLIGWYWITRATSEGVRWLDELLASARGHLQGHALALFMRGFLAVLQSDPAAALPALDRAATAAKKIGHPSLQSQSLSMASVAANMAGDRAAARHLLAQALDIPTGPDDYLAAIAVLQARALGGLFEDDLDTARSAASQGVRLARQAGDLYSLEMMLLNLACATLIAGDLDETPPLGTESLRIARRIDDRVAQYYLIGALGCHAASSGQPRRAARLLAAAETMRTAIGGAVIPFLAPILARAEQSTMAALGATRFQAELDAGTRLSRDAAIALALGEPAPTADTSSVQAGTAPLGKRQVQVARLVADGLTNKQIATRLFISEHTVDSHIHSILNKLGFTSRAQIAAWMASSTAGRWKTPPSTPNAPKPSTTMSDAYRSTTDRAVRRDERAGWDTCCR
jgi:predicted ATPase/DNA-binding CsgD family transcriptional regulator